MSGEATLEPTLEPTMAIDIGASEKEPANQLKIKFTFPHKESPVFNPAELKDKDKSQLKITFLKNIFEFEEKNPFDLYVRNNKASLLVHILRNKLEDLVANAMDAGATEVSITLLSSNSVFSSETASGVIIEDNGLGFPGFEKSKYPLFETYTPSNTRSTKQGDQKTSHIGGLGKALKIIHDWIAEDALRTGKEGQFAFDKGNRGRKPGARLHWIYQSPKPLSVREFDQLINPDHHLSSPALSSPALSSPALAVTSPTVSTGAGAGTKNDHRPSFSSEEDASGRSSDRSSGTISSASLAFGSTCMLVTGSPPCIERHLLDVASVASRNPIAVLKSRLGVNFFGLTLGAQNSDSDSDSDSDLNSSSEPSPA